MVEALLRQTNLWDVRKEKLGSYSGGMRQRFGVAVALLGDPRLIIVDEPTAGLDPAERVRFLNLLSGLGEKSVVILSTHIVEDVAELCSRMAIINRGEILLEAEPLRAVEALRGRIWRRTVARLLELRLRRRLVDEPRHRDEGEPGQDAARLQPELVAQHSAQAHDATSSEGCAGRAPE